MESRDLFIKNMAECMFGKFNKYWSEFCTILAIASIMDPQYKLDGISYVFKITYGENSVKFKNVRSKLFNIFEEYTKISTTSISNVGSNREMSSSSLIGNTSSSNDLHFFLGYLSYLHIYLIV